ncbi:acyl-CoA/acyl-ACP dehydrogenase [Alcaligenaceae bacterium]|nr:acyl-CoA/acyl-ACP dehydrogenase [Alcaligenaceae bacterium]
MQENSLSDTRLQLEMLRESAVDFVARNTDLKRLRERRNTLPGYDPDHLRHMAELGWLGIMIPEEHGGLGLGFAELTVVLQELGKGLMADPLASIAFATRVLHLGSNTDLQQQLLPQVVDAKMLPCVAWQEGLGNIDPSVINTRADVDGTDILLTGTKRFVAGAAGASGFVVSARSDSGCGLYWVDAQVPGLTVEHEQRADGTPSGLLRFDKVRIAPQYVVSTAGSNGLAAIERALDEAATLAGAEMLGVSEAALQLALNYMRTRVQFGKPIGSFQALQHKATDLYVQQELMRAVLGDAVHTLDDTNASTTERAFVASRYKARASDAGLRITREVIQLHGAIGFTEEYDAGLYLKRALVLSAWLGNATAHRRRFAALQQKTEV